MEFALVLPVFLLLTVVVIDLGRGIYYYNTLSNCAREGARFGVVLTDAAWGDPEYTSPGNTPGTYASAAPYAGTDTIVGVVAKRLGSLNAAQTKVIVDMTPYAPPFTFDAHMRLPLTVKLEYPYTPLFAEILGGGTITLHASAMMRTQ
ncbi:MAG: TadE family protein [Chloroflexota bacterium]